MPVKRSTVQAAQSKTILSEILGISNPNFINALFVITFLVSLGWFTDSMFYLLLAFVDAQARQPSLYESLLGIMPFPFMLFIFYLRWLYYQTRAKPQAKSSEVKPHEGVILFLSPLRNDDTMNAIGAGHQGAFEGCAWRMVELGLEKHREVLKHVWVLCSVESFKQVSLFRQVFEKKFPNVHFHFSDAGLGFDAVPDLVKAIEAIYEDLPQDIDEVGVVIDVTGGYKTASIAGFMASLVSPLREIQYVHTNNEKVLTYAYEIKTLGKDFKS